MKKLKIMALLLAACTVFTAGCQTQKTESTDTGKEAQSSDDKKEEKKEERPADLDKAVKADDTKLEKPAKPGQWVETTIISLEDYKYHTVYVKVTKVTGMAEDKEYVNSCISEHNTNTANLDKIDVAKLKLPDDVEIAFVDYDIFVPGDFPESSYGISEPKIEFKAMNMKGGDIPASDGKHVYMNIGRGGAAAMPENADYEAGKTYSLKGYFTMVKGYKGYALSVPSFPNGGTKNSEAGNAYFGVK